MQPLQETKVWMPSGKKDGDYVVKNIPIDGGHPATIDYVKEVPLYCFAKEELAHLLEQTAAFGYIIGAEEKSIETARELTLNYIKQLLHKPV